MLIYWYIHGIVIFVSILSMLFLPLLYSNLVICLFSFTSYLPSSSSPSYPSPSISFPSSPFSLCPPLHPNWTRSEVRAERRGPSRSFPRSLRASSRSLCLSRVSGSLAPFRGWFGFVCVSFLCFLFLFFVVLRRGGVASLSVWNFLGFVSFLLWFLFLFRFVVISSFFFANFHLWCVF